MSQTNSFRMPEHVDYEISYNLDGKKCVLRGKAEMSLNRECDYEDVYYDSLSPITSVKTYDQTTITLKTLKMEPKPVEKITTSRTVKVNDFTFGAVSVARKKAGAPKKATFELVTRDSKDYSLRTEKVVVFTWDEVL